MKNFLLRLLVMTAIASRALAADSSGRWQEIKVDVLADRPVVTAHTLKQDADGFQRLAITLTNEGPQPLTLERITVHIPPVQLLTDDLEIVYGGSCMGQTPLLRQNVRSPTAHSSSHMYEMVRLADGDYLFAGSLSWRIFMPNFTLKNGAFEIWSNGEGKQLKPGETIQYEQIVLRRADNWLDLLNHFNLIIEVRRKEGTDRDRVYFDFSHPGARAHIAGRIRTIVQDYGFPYVKIDFMRFGLNQDILRNKPAIKSIRAHDPTITDVERMRLGLQAMRDAVGRENYLLGCSAVFGPCIGFVDGMRTGGDISPRFEAFAERSLANLGHFYLSGKVFNGDMDYLTFRSAADEDDKVSKEEVKHGGSMTMNEAQMWADLNKLYGNCRLSSDNLMPLRPERQALVKEVFEYPAMDETVPLDLWQHGTTKSDGFELVIARKGVEIHLGVFNWSDTPKDYTLAAFGKSGSFTLGGRHSVVLKYDGNESFAQLCQKLISK